MPGSTISQEGLRLFRLRFLHCESLHFMLLAVLVEEREQARLVERELSAPLEAAALMGALVFLGYVIFFVHWMTVPPGLLYSLVPFLLWAALRFGSKGVSTSVTSFTGCQGPAFPGEEGDQPCGGS
jgi:hypothetical protein